jgi:hypothetical protein
MTGFIQRASRFLSHENTGRSCLRLGEPGLKILSRFSAQSNESWSCIDKLALF